MANAIDFNKTAILVLDGKEYFCGYPVFNDEEKYVNLSRWSYGFTSFWNFNYSDWNLLAAGCEIEVECQDIFGGNKRVIKAQLKNVRKNYKLKD